MFLLPKTTLAGRGAGDRVLARGAGDGRRIRPPHRGLELWYRIPGPSTSRFWGTAVMEPGGPEGLGAGDADRRRRRRRPTPPSPRPYGDLRVPRPRRRGLGGPRTTPDAPVARRPLARPPPGPLQHRAAPWRLQAVERGRPGPGAGARPEPLRASRSTKPSSTTRPRETGGRPARRTTVRTYHSTAVLLPDGARAVGRRRPPGPSAGPRRRARPGPPGRRDGPALLAALPGPRAPVGPVVTGAPPSVRCPTAPVVPISR